MNRPANLTPAPGLSSGNTAFRPPYPPSLGSQSGQQHASYGPPRGATNGGRASGNFMFSGGQGLDVAESQRQQQQQSRSALQQQQQAMQQHLQQLSLNQHPPSGSNSSSSLQLHSAGLASGQGNPDREFPALGSSSSNASSSLPPVGGNSYATQAGTAAQLGQGSNTNGSTGFGPDDFPALGQAGGNELNSTGSHGLNGTAMNAQELAAQHRQNLLGSLPTSQQRVTPSNEAQQRHLAQQYQNQMMKDSKGSAVSSGQFANWNGHQVGSQSAPLGSDLLGPPPGVGIANQQGSHQSSTGSQHSHSQNQNQPQGPTTAAGQEPSADNRPSLVPLTPVQQVLASPADRWGLLSLLAAIRNDNPESAVLGMGVDLSAAGYDLSTSEPLYPSLITPFSDALAAQLVEPEFHVPSVYNVHPPPPGPNKAASFSDETLFFMFYSSPRDVLQELAAQELHNRNWRFHKEFRLWLTKESGTAPSQKAAAFERGVYTFFDPESWERIKKDTVVMYDLLEEKAPLAVAGGIANAPTSQQQGGPNPQQSMPPGIGLLGQGHQQLGQQQQPPAAHLNQSQPPHPNAQHLHQQQQQQQQLADQIRMQNMNARYQGTRTPGLGGI